MITKTLESLTDFRPQGSQLIITHYSQKVDTNYCSMGHHQSYQAFNISTANENK